MFEPSVQIVHEMHFSSQSFHPIPWLFGGGAKGGSDAEELGFVINEGCRRKSDWRMPYACVKLDISAAFDSVFSSPLFKALHFLHVPQYLACLVVRELGHRKAKWSLEDINTQHDSLLRGLAQGSH